MKYNTILFCLFSFFFTYSQDFSPNIKYLPELPVKNDFSFLKEELKGVNVVLLGEHTHFDGNGFEIKTEIIKYLVEEMGYTTIAFESGVYELSKAYKNIQAGTPTNIALQNAVFGVWGKKNEFQSFCDFFEKNKNKLKLCGFDPQITGAFTSKELTDDLFDYAKKIKFKFKFNKDDFELLLEAIDQSQTFDESDISAAQFKSELLSFISKVAKLKETNEEFYWKQIANNLIELRKFTIDGYTTRSSFYGTVSDNLRDKQMAENLLTYIKTHPDEKIICWGASIHFANNMKSVKDPMIKDFIPMGSYIKQELKEKAYSLTLNSAQDSIYLVEKWEKTPIKENSFEDYLKKLNTNKLVFISSNQNEMQKDIYHRLFSPITFINSKLNELYDGFLYLPIIKRSTSIDIEINTKNASLSSNEIVLDYTNSNLSEKELENTIKIEEVIIYNKRTPYQILNKTIDSLEKNYPVNEFNSVLQANIKTTIADSLYLDFDFVADQSENGYANSVFRSTKSVKEIKWNIKNDYIPQTLREYHGLVYDNPIKDLPFLRKNKFKKFQLILEEVVKIDNEDVYKIYFSSPRNHSSFTTRRFLSNYSGYVFINKKDNAIVKVIENWEVVNFPEESKFGYHFTNSLAKYTSKEYVNESEVTDFKKVDNLYLISSYKNTVLGNVITDLGEKETFEIEVNANWKNFNFTNSDKIKFKNEVHLFQKVNFNTEFWSKN